MKHYNDKQLDEKIQSFLARKADKFSGISFSL